MLQFQNYHRHSYYTNVRVSDSAASNEDYAKRAAEIGHGIISTCEHGTAGRYIEGYELAEKYNLKFLMGAEAYWVKDRFEKDRTNCHIYIGARNENGRQAINDVLSEACLTGFYGQPRIDIPLLLSLPARDMWVTSACLAFWKYDDVDDIVAKLKDHFGKNFYLEVQYHNTDRQREINRRILALSKLLNIPLIMGCDSHYIYEEGAIERADFIASKGMEYADEAGWFMDYPDGDTAYKRFADQCVLSHEQILEAINNTNVFLEVEPYENPCFTHDVKMPTLYPDWTQEQKDAEYDRLIWDAWETEKQSVPQSRWAEYEREIKRETDIVHTTLHSDYFLLDHEIIKRGRELGGVITSTGRGCFTGEALVHTTESIKNLSDIEIGDRVFSEDGHAHTVLNTFQYVIEEPMIQIEHAYGSSEISPLICTKDHKILIHRDNENIWIKAEDVQLSDMVCAPKIHFDDEKKSHYDLINWNIFGYSADNDIIYEKRGKIKQSYQYNPSDVARHIGVGKSIVENLVNGKLETFKRRPEKIVDLLEYIPFNTIDEYRKYVNDNRTIRVNRIIQNDVIFNQFIGMMYGDGFILNSPEKCVVGLAINTQNHKNIINRSIFFEIARRFNVDVYEHQAKNKNLTQLIINSRVVCEFLSGLLFKSDISKHKVFNSELFNQNIDNLHAIYLGMHLTDGTQDDRYSFDNTSLSICNAYKLLGMATTNQIYTITHRRPFRSGRYSCQGCYKIRCARNCVKQKYRIKSDTNFIYLPVHSVKCVDSKKQIVYDLMVEGCHSYLINNMIVHNSGVSFITNKLLGLTDVDRIAATVKMYPERFMSPTRILETKSLADLDINCGNPSVFAKAQKEILGEDHAYPMIAYGTMKPKAAWKMYAKSQNVDFEIANEVSAQIGKYEKAVAHANEDDRDTIDVHDYIEQRFHEIYDQSEIYRGVVVSASIHPCSYLLYQGNIRREIGLTRAKDNIVCCMDGKWAEEYKFLKNDLLKVSVVDLIDRVYKRVGQERHSIRNLLAECPPTSEVWDVYKKGCTLGINQCEQDGTRQRVMKYAPHNISEICAFVAAIRPGFKSMYSTFESRKHFDYGIKSLDDLIQTPEMPNSFIMYQEQSMAALNYAGIPMSECYEIIKNIAKKRVEKVLKYKDQFLNEFAKAIMRNENTSAEMASQLSIKVWQILEDSSKYLFNASHSYCVALDSLYGAYLKTKYTLEFYETFLRVLEEKGDKDRMAAVKDEAESYFNIKFPPYRFGQDNRSVVANHASNEITNTMSAIKGFGESVGEMLYECGQQSFASFIEVLKWLDEHGIKSSKTTPLIKIDYFMEFGNVPTLLAISEMFDFFKQGSAKTIKKENAGQYEDSLLKFSIGVNAKGVELKSYSITDCWALMLDAEQHIRALNLPDLDYKEKANIQIELLGYVDLTTGKEEDRKKLIITDYRPLLSKDDGNVWAYRLFTRSIGSGKSAAMTCYNKVYRDDPIKTGDIIYVKAIAKNNAGYWMLQDYDKIA